MKVTFILYQKVFKQLLTGERCIRHSLCQYSSFSSLRNFKSIIEKTYALPGVAETYFSGFYASKKGKLKLEIIQKYYYGGDLQIYFDHNSMAIEKIYSLYSNILTGLSSLHKQGIVHNDIKLSNFFLEKDEKAVIGDFDQSFMNAPYSAIHGGTLGYLDPQRALVEVGENVDIQNFTKMDVFSTGVAFFNMVQEKMRHTEIGRHIHNYTLIQTGQLPLDEIANLIEIPLFSIEHLCMGMEESKLLKYCANYFEKKWPQEPKNHESLEYFFWKICHINPEERFSADESLLFLDQFLMPSTNIENHSLLLRNTSLQISSYSVAKGSKRQLIMQSNAGLQQKNSRVIPRKRCYS